MFGKVVGTNGSNVLVSQKGTVVEFSLNEIKECYSHDSGLLKMKLISIPNITPEMIKGRCLTYSFEYKTLYVSKLNETIYKNGREIQRKNLKELDRISEDLGLTTDQKITKSFAIFPTTLTSGERIWLKSYYSFLGTRWGSGLHSGWYWTTVATAKSIPELQELIIKLVLK